MRKETFTDRLDQLMAGQGMSKADLARETGIKYHRLNEWWRKETVAKAGDLDVLVKFFTVTPDFLLYGVPLPTSEEEDRRETLAKRIKDLDEALIDDVEEYVDFLESRKPPVKTDSASQ